MMTTFAQSCLCDLNWAVIQKKARCGYVWLSATLWMGLSLLCIYPACPCNDRDFCKSPTTAAATLSFCLLACPWKVTLTPSTQWPLFSLSLCHFGKFSNRGGSHTARLFTVFALRSCRYVSNSLHKDGSVTLLHFFFWLKSKKKQAEPVKKTVQSCSCLWASVFWFFYNLLSIRFVVSGGRLRLGR